MPTRSTRPQAISGISCEGDPDEELLDLATTLIDKKTGKFDATYFHDRYVEALRELIDRKKKGKTLNPIESGDVRDKENRALDWGSTSST